MLRTVTQAMAILGALAIAGPASAGFIDFGGFGHGQVIHTQYAASDGLTITAYNPNRTFQRAVIFDSALSGTRDDDLEGPPGRAWAGGNAAPDAAFGNILIVQENDVGCGDGVCDRPDDEGTANGGGDLIFTFAARIASFGFDAVDLESDQAAGARLLFYDGAGPAVATLFLSAFECAVGPFCDPTVDFAGDNSANHLPDVSASALGIAGFDRVVIDLNGSGGVDNVRWSTAPDPISAPEPGLFWLLVPALAAGRLCGRARA